MVNVYGYIKSATLGGQQISPENFPVSGGGAGPLQVTMGTKMAEVDVRVAGAAADRQVSVLLYPEDPERLGAGLERVTTGTDRMAMPGIPPGRYRLLATDSIYEGAVAEGAGAIEAEALAALQMETRKRMSNDRLRTELAGLTRRGFSILTGGLR